MFLPYKPCINRKKTLGVITTANVYQLKNEKNSENHVKENQSVIRS